MSIAVEPFVVAGAIGFVLGFERERHAWREGETATALGARTFTVIAVAGSSAAVIGPTAVALGLGVVGLLVVAAYWRTSDVHRGMTTEATAVLAFLLGAVTREDMAAAAGVAVAVALLLEQKERIRHLLRDVVTDVEVDDALRFVAMAVVVLPLLPNHAIDRWGVIDPHRVWLLVVVLAGIGWVGYVATRVLGPRRGLPVAGLAGGFVSGSATTAVMAATARADPGAASGALSGALAASVATCVQVLAITAVVDITVWRAMAPAVAAGAVVLVIEAIVVARHTPANPARNAADDRANDSTAGVTRRPLQFRASITIAAVLTATLVVSAVLTERFGAGAAVLTAAVAGLADSHAASVGVVSLTADGTIGSATAIAGVGAALAVNTVVKIVLAATSGGARFARRLALALVLPVVVIGLGMWWAAVAVSA
ncbi:MAG: DUF4010 domain-containing protein [Ilumatobacteraceae bacterium]